ncbi:hypothetical protein, partial [Klebsiella variicola]|uniref:hypothetical protein n=1 Tax=Klebsiella variicola TaxID=244366 RepID=UPI00272EF308
LVARYPDKVYSHLRDLLSKPYDYTHQLLQSYYLPYQILPDPNRAGSVAAIKVDDGQVYTFEEMLGMLFNYALDLAEFHS